MKILLKIIYFLMPLLCSLESSLGNNTVIFVKNCLDRNSEEWSRSIMFQMLAYTTDGTELDLHWEIYKIINARNITVKVTTKTKYSRGYNFVLEPYSLGKGLYKIVVLSTKRPKCKMNRDCFLRIHSESCYASIDGGYLQEYKPWETITVDGSPSLDYCYPQGKNNSLEYTWSCKQKIGTGFCPYTTTGTDSKFIIPKEFVANGQEFVVTLTVENEDRFISLDIQNIAIRVHVMQYHMQCIINCPPWTRVDTAIVLEVKCTKYCGHPCKASWLVFQNDKLLQRAEDQGKCQSNFLCSFKMSVPGRFDFVYRCKGPTVSGGATMRIEFNRDPEITCKIDPMEGTTYSTQFQVSCEINPKQTIRFIEVYSFENELGDLITTWPPPKDHKFRLPLGTKQILVRALVHPKVFSQTILNVTVKNDLAPKTSKESIKKILNLYKGSGEGSITSQLEKDRVEALGMINSLWNEINNMSQPDNEQFEEFLDNLKLHTIDDLLSIPVVTGDSLIQMDSAVNNLLFNHNKSNPLLEKSLSMICKKLANDYVYMMENGNDLYFRATVENIGIAETLADCSVKIVNENYDLLKPETEISEGEQPSTERQPVIEIITEDYPDYIDFGEEYYNNLENLEETGSNILDVTAALSKAVAGSMKLGYRKYTSDSINVSVYQKHGSFFHKELGTEGVTVFPSRDIYRSEREYLFTLQSWKKNLFWWTETAFKPHTFIADISFEDKRSGKQLSHFETPHYIHFDVVSQPLDLRSETFSVSVPSAYHKEKAEEGYMNSFIKIHRINVFRHQGIFVQFQDLRGQEFLIVIKNFEMPVIEDFKRKGVILVNENNTFSSYENDNDYDSWYYVGVLPHRNMVKSSIEQQTFEYNISFSAPVCYEFTFGESWRRSCKGSVSTSTHIVCKCNHLSIIAGKIEYAISTVSQFVDNELELEIDSERKIFWLVLTLFSVFCFFMLYGRYEHELYYAADNNYNERYAYLIVVRTGRYRQLTSHVVMRITGTKGHTPPHVLNYPDPNHRIFQGGSEDWIVVTTPGSLGDIKNIEIWHDNYGLKPTWYCKDVVIHDIQTEQKWLFKINQTISVCHEYKIKIAPLELSKNKCKRLCDVLSLSGEHEFWNIFLDYVHHMVPYIQRLLLVYSKLITPLFVVAAWQGLPAMENFDSIDPYNYFFDGYLFLIGLGSSFLSFFVHSVIVWWLPHHTMYFSIPLIIANNTLLIIFGFWIPYYSSIRIILAWLFGILLDIAVYNKLWRILRKLAYGVELLNTSKGIPYQNIKENIDVQREILHQMFETAFIFKVQQMAVPLRGKKFRHRKREVIRRTKLGQQFKDLVMFGIYMILLYALVSIEKDHLVFRNQHVIRDLFRGIFSRTRNVKESQHISDIYDYMNTTLVEVMHCEDWYPSYHDEDPGMLLDRSNKYIGVVKVRQLRVVPRICDIKLLNESVTCGPEYSQDEEDRRTFVDAWTRSSPYIDIHKRLTSMWIYSNADTTSGMKIKGLFASYPGSGYLVTMGRNRQNSIANIHMIQSNHWIDRFTRSIIIEFLTYSVNHNVFNFVQLLMERSATGLLNNKVMVLSARMIYVGSELERRSLLIYILFVIWLAVLFLNKTKFIIREKLTYLKNFWSLLDLAIIIISLCCIIIYMARVKSVGEFLLAIERAQRNTVVKYSDLFDTHITLNVIAAVLVCISTVRLWKLVRFFKMFRLFEKTFRLVFSPVLALFLHHIIFMLAYTMVTHILFGEHSTYFVNFEEALKSLFKIYLGLFKNYTFFIHFGSKLEMTLIVIYIIASKIFFANYVVTCVLGHLDARKLFSQYQDEAYSFVDYLKEELMFLFTWLKLRKTHHHKERLLKKKVIDPKPDRYLYANCISTTTHAMHAMAVVAAVVLYNKIHNNPTDGNLTEKQIELMLRVCHYFLAEHDRDCKEFFFKVHRRKTLTIVDAKRIDKEKRVVEIMLGVSAKMEKRHKENRRLVLRHTMKDLDKMQKKLQICLHSLQNIEFVEYFE